MYDGKKNTKIAFEIVKSFVDQYEDNNAIDEILANILCDIIINAGSAIHEDIEKSKAKGLKIYTGRQCGNVALVKLKQLVENMEQSLMNSVDYEKGVIL